MDEPIISTKEKPGEYDGLETAKPGEPVFTLQGGDMLAAPTIEFWADSARKAARIEPNADIAKKLLTKATKADFAAWAFRDYQAGRGAEVIAEEKRIAALDPIDETVILARGADRCNNAVAEMVELAEKLAKMGIHLDEAELLFQAAALIRDVSSLIEPRRNIRGR